MKNHLLVVILLCSVTGIVFAKDKPCKPNTHAKIPAIGDFLYDKARKVLIAAKWQPVNITRQDENVSSEKPYKEMEECSGTGLGFCNFLFKDTYGNYLRVTTAGENRQIYSFQFACDDLPRQFSKSTKKTTRAKDNSTAKPFYKFYDDGGEHPTVSCETVSKLPAKLKKAKRLFPAQNYLGSKQTEFAEDNEATLDAWEHYFSTSTACDKAVKKNYHCYETNGEDKECQALFK